MAQRVFLCLEVIIYLKSHKVNSSNSIQFRNKIVQFGRQMSYSISHVSLLFNPVDSLTQKRAQISDQLPILPCEEGQHCKHVVGDAAGHVEADGGGDGVAF